MQHSDFQIGAEFTMSGKRWRCTDIGTRTITAISLEPRDRVRSYVDESGQRVREEYVSNDPRDLNGPPYGVVEYMPEKIDVKAIRQKMGMSQQQFCSTFGLSLGSLRHWEQGLRTKMLKSSGFLRQMINYE